MYQAQIMCVAVWCEKKKNYTKQMGSQIVCSESKWRSRCDLKHPGHKEVPARHWLHVKALSIGLFGTNNWKLTTSLTETKPYFNEWHLQCVKEQKHCRWGVGEFWSCADVRCIWEAASLEAFGGKTAPYVFGKFTWQCSFTYIIGATSKCFCFAGTK